MDNPDFIIVGAGSSGCVMAERLSASGRHKVLLLEAGGDDRRFFVQMPLGYGKTFFDKRVNWMYRAEPDPGLAGNIDHWPRGRVLGGSSSINAMVWVRGARADFDEWRDAGNPDWGADEICAAFREIECAAIGDDAVRGRSGPLKLFVPNKTVHPLTRKWFESAQAIGLPMNPDFNGDNQDGVGLFEFTIHKGRRLSSARAFLRPAMSRPNLRVITGAHVTGLTFDGQRATGVTYMRRGKTVTIKAGCEVILSGGSVNSPQLLQLSGIGPADHLQSLGIGVRADNAHVGRNLEDHIGTNYTFRANCPTINQQLGPLWGKLSAGMRYLLMRDGPLSVSLNQAGGFIRTDPNRTRPNMQLYFQAFSTVLPRPGERPILSPDPWPGFSIGWSNCRPKSRGEIMIRSADPFEPPKIAANALSHPDDVAEMLATGKIIRRMAATRPLADYIETELLPGPDVIEDEALIEDFRRRSGTVYHPVATCRMGPDPARAVVDSRLRVHGVGGLRVVDCSVFPNIVTGNTNAAAMATAWRASELVLQDNT
ncbi:GMC family oxidoreductase N-terminal domain-containing protein [Hoeflea sp. G2-23]|uniref:GMC family oxidoreductase N-terminal domain-containing protein n=1 Tax=Hoeflea algicola TaxID=2983763 RepID=A0ABT3ZFI8_9HYPH|nr:GMC family oxidoreductase N-terminal domain-containing protein [Hoeflea algicola]MCY0150458.1 GMC family oxidoreductase N-terminal domain-containing protein [Hoeflea algicola]